MWALGHCATGYLASRSFYPRNKSFDASRLGSIFLFAVAIDVAHYHVLRTLTHSLIFFVPFVLGLLWLFSKQRLIEPYERLPLFIAAASHILADGLFGGFAFLVPFDFTEYSVFQWGSYLNLGVESLLTCIMLAVLSLTGDLYARPRTKRYHRWVFGLLIVLGVIQLGMIFYNDFLKGPNLYDGKVYNDGSLPGLTLLFAALQAVFVLVALSYFFREAAQR